MYPFLQMCIQYTARSIAVFWVTFCSQTFHCKNEKNKLKSLIDYISTSWNFYVKGFTPVLYCITENTVCLLTQNQQHKFEKECFAFYLICCALQCIWGVPTMGWTDIHIHFFSILNHWFRCILTCWNLTCYFGQCRTHYFLVETGVLSVTTNLCADISVCRFNTPF